MDAQIQENQILKQKLDNLWNKYEEEKEIVMTVTKNEVEKVKAEEIERLRQQIESAEEMNRELRGRLSVMDTIQEDNREHINDKVRIKADNEILESKLQRLLIANK